MQVNNLLQKNKDSRTFNNMNFIKPGANPIKEI